MGSPVHFLVEEVYVLTVSVIAKNRSQRAHVVQQVWDMVEIFIHQRLLGPGIEPDDLRIGWGILTGDGGDQTALAPPQ